MFLLDVYTILALKERPEPCWFDYVFLAIGIIYYLSQGYGDYVVSALG